MADLVDDFFSGLGTGQKLYNDRENQALRRAQQQVALTGLQNQLIEDELMVQPRLQEQRARHGYNTALLNADTHSLSTVRPYQDRADVAGLANQASLDNQQREIRANIDGLTKRTARYDAEQQLVDSSLNRDLAHDTYGQRYGVGVANTATNLANANTSQLGAETTHRATLNNITAVQQAKEDDLQTTANVNAWARGLSQDDLGSYGVQQARTTLNDLLLNQGVNTPQERVAFFDNLIADPNAPIDQKKAAVLERADMKAVLDSEQQIARRAQLEQRIAADLPGIAQEFGFPIVGVDNNGLFVLQQSGGGQRTMTPEELTLLVRKQAGLDTTGYEDTAEAGARARIGAIFPKDPMTGLAIRTEADGKSAASYQPVANVQNVLFNNEMYSRGYLLDQHGRWVKTIHGDRYTASQQELDNAWSVANPPTTEVN